MLGWAQGAPRIVGGTPGEPSREHVIVAVDAEQQVQVVETGSSGEVAFATTWQLDGRPALGAFLGEEGPAKSPRSGPNPLVIVGTQYPTSLR